LRQDAEVAGRVGQWHLSRIDRATQSAIWEVSQHAEGFEICWSVGSDRPEQCCILSEYGSHWILHRGSTRMDWQAEFVDARRVLARHGLHSITQTEEPMISTPHHRRQRTPRGHAVCISRRWRWAAAADRYAQ
jgi:hypothetical protein